MANDPEFVGATDSGIPVCMMLEMATILTPILAKINQAADDDEKKEKETKKKNEKHGGECRVVGQYGDTLLREGVSLQMIFFDGEEAFVAWTNEDSV